MFRAIVLFLCLGAVAWIAAYFADYPGRVTLDLGGWRIETYEGVAFAALLSLVALAVFLFRITQWIGLRPGAWRENRTRRRRARGYQVLSQGLVAVAAGDTRQGEKLARRARQLLEGEPLTHLLAAQAAQLDGNEDEARRQFEQLRQAPESSFLGARGLLVLAQRDGDVEGARALAAQAVALRPDAAWAVLELFQLQSAEDDWAGALATLEQAKRHKAIDRPTLERRRGVALIGRARQRLEAGETRLAMDDARQARQLVPDLVEASALLVRLHAAAGDLKRGRRVLGDAWPATPNPRLAEAAGQLWAGLDTQSRLKEARQTIAGRPDHLESRLLLAEHALAAEAWDEARQALEAALADGPDGRVYRLRAALALADGGGETAARQWLERAAMASDAHAWRCAACGWRGEGWRASCPHCGAFDRIEWGRPPGAPKLLAPPPPPPAEAATAEQETEAEAEIVKPPAALLKMVDTASRAAS